MPSVSLAGLGSRGEPFDMRLDPGIFDEGRAGLVGLGLLVLGLLAAAAVWIQRRGGMKPDSKN